MIQSPLIIFNPPWDQFYDYFGIKDFIYFISSPSIQDQLFWMKLIFVLFGAVFFCAVIWFYINSSYVRYKFLLDTVEFLSWQPYGLRVINKRLRVIEKRLDGGTQNDFKLALIEVDDFLYQVLDESGYEGETFEELIHSAHKKISNTQDILSAHEVRNKIVYDTSYTLDTEAARKMISDYELALKNVAGGK